MSRPLPDFDEVFVLRFWREDAGFGVERKWRGQVSCLDWPVRRQTVPNVEAALALVRTHLQSVAKGTGREPHDD